MLFKILANGLEVTIDGESAVISMNSRTVSVPEITQDYLVFEVDKAIDRAKNIHHDKNYQNRILSSNIFLIQISMT